MAVIYIKMLRCFFNYLRLLLWSVLINKLCIGCSVKQSVLGVIEVNDRDKDFENTVLYV